MYIDKTRRTCKAHCRKTTSLPSSIRLAYPAVDPPLTVCCCKLKYTKMTIPASGGGGGIRWHTRRDIVEWVFFSTCTETRNFARDHMIFWFLLSEPSLASCQMYEYPAPLWRHWHWVSGGGKTTATPPTCEFLL